jgi:hypothetical protein
MPRKTKTQIGMMLADYDAAIRDQRKAEKRAAELKAEIRELNLKDGTYGTMTFALGTPREILDQPKAREVLKAAGIPIPPPSPARRSWSSRSSSEPQDWCGGRVGHRCGDRRDRLLGRWPDAGRQVRA